LLIDEQGEPLFKAQLRRVRGFQLQAEGACHTMQLHRLELVQRRLIQHSVPLVSAYCKKSWGGS
jgi:hypothetical protein